MINQKQKRRASYIIYGLAILAIFVAPRLFQLLTDWYWFVEVGFSNIFTTILYSKILLGLGVGTLTFFVIYGNLWLAGRLVASRPLVIRLPANQGEQERLQEIDLGRHVNKFALAVSLLIGFLTSLFGAGNWETVLKYFNAVPFNTLDPIFGRDIGFYFFDLPFIQFLVGFGFWLIIISFIGAAASYFLRGAITLRQTTPGAGVLSAVGGSAFGGKSLYMEKPIRVHLSILIAFFLCFNQLQDLCHKNSFSAVWLYRTFYRCRLY